MAKGLGSLKDFLKQAAPVIGAVAGGFIPGAGALGPAVGSFAGSMLSGRSAQDSLINAGIAGLGGYLLGNSGAAQAGGYTGLGGGPSLGSALMSGVGSQGIGSVFSAGPPQPTAGMAPGATASSSTSANVSASPSVKPSAIAGPTLAGGGENAAGGIGDLIKKNPLMTSALVAGGMYLLNGMEPKFDPMKEADPRFRQSGADLLASNPGKYGFNKRNFMSDGGMIQHYAEGGAVQALAPDINKPSPLPQGTLPPGQMMTPRQHMSFGNGMMQPPGMMNRPAMPPGLENRMMPPEMLQALMQRRGMPVQMPPQAQGMPVQQLPQDRGMPPPMPMQAQGMPRRPMAGGGHVAGPGGPKSDAIPAMLSDGEFVMTSQAVKNLGNGDRMKGAAIMYNMMKGLENRMGQRKR